MTGGNIQLPEVGKEGFEGMASDGIFFTICLSTELLPSSRGKIYQETEAGKVL
jgi:hypothetical protein